MNINSLQAWQCIFCSVDNYIKLAKLIGEQLTNTSKAYSVQDVGKEQNIQKEARKDQTNNLCDNNIRKLRVNKDGINLVPISHKNL